MKSAPAPSEYITLFKGGFINMLRWEQLDALWNTLNSQVNKNWYIYAVGEEPPVEPSNHEQLQQFTTEMDKLLHAEHQESYCGIVYADNPNDPEFIKIYDPNNLGHVCGSCPDAPPTLPGWVLSLTQPVNLHQASPPPGNRRRWWSKLFK